MKLSHTLAATAAAASLSVLLVGTASADPDCEAAARAAVSAVDAATAADKADAAADEAKKALAEASLDGTVVNPGDVDRLDELEAKAADETDPNHELAAEKVKLIEAHQKAEAAAEAAQGEADKTDADALHDAADEALAAAGEACKADPLTEDVAAPLADDGDSQVAVLPDTSEGVDTGAW